MAYQQIRFEQKDRVALLTLHRPDKLNAWTHEMRRELVDAISTVNDDPDYGAIVVTGAGRGFCAGADIGATFQKRTTSSHGDSEQDGTPLEDRVDWVSFVRASKPILGAINGVAVGVGITQALPFDLLIGSTAARIGMFFVKMALVPELGSSQLLVQRVGFAKASEMCLIGKLYDAKELEGTGFFNEIVAPDELLPRALELAAQISANPSGSLRAIKRLLTVNATEQDLAVVQERELEELGRAYASAQHHEAVQAFLEKRAPDFRGASERH